MADSERVPTEVIDAAMRASGSIERFYCAGGGSLADLRTDISYVAEAVLMALADVAVATPHKVPRRITTPAYSGADRRRRPRPPQ